jgi:protein TonB
MAAYVQQNNSRRMSVLAGIVVFHVLLGYGLVSGLARKVVEVIAPPLETDLIEELAQEDKPPPPPPPQMERPPVEVPPPEVSIDIPMDAPPTTAITNVTDRPMPPAPPPPPPAPAGPTVKAKIDARRFPSSEDYYPASAKRLGQQGSPAVRVCVGPNGRLVGEPTISGSSGIESLDQGAIKLAKAGRYIAAQTNGQPVEDCFSFRVKFELKD